MKRSNLFERDYAPSWSVSGQYYSDGGTVITDTACAYCGERATDREHLVPYSFISDLIKATQGADKSLWTWILPACSECNGIAHDQLYISAASKRKFIQDRLEAKYADLIDVEPWTDDDYQDMGPTLLQYVKARQAQADILRQRIRYRGPLPPFVGSESMMVALRSEMARRRIKDAS
jgi:hypothetical protein